MFSKRSYLITIPKPCNEHWNKMKPEAKGRYCLNCKKDVIDFSEMSDAELILFLNQSKGNVCGRFDSYQINRNITDQNSKAPYKFWRKLVAGVLTLISVKTSFAQTKAVIAERTTVSPTAKKEGSQVTGTLNKDLTLSGKVSLPAEIPANLTDVTITIGNDEVQINPDSLGNYSIVLQEHQLKEFTTVAFSHPNMARQVRLIHRSNFPHKINVDLEKPRLKRHITGLFIAPQK